MDLLEELVNEHVDTASTQYCYCTYASNVTGIFVLVAPTQAGAVSLSSAFLSQNGFKCMQPDCLSSLLYNMLLTHTRYTLLFKPKHLKTINCQVLVLALPPHQRAPGFGASWQNMAGMTDACSRFQALENRGHSVTTHSTHPNALTPRSRRTPCNPEINACKCTNTVLSLQYSACLQCCSYSKSEFGSQIRYTRTR